MNKKKLLEYLLLAPNVDINIDVHHKDTVHHVVDVTGLIQLLNQIKESKVSILVGK